MNHKLVQPPYCTKSPSQKNGGAGLGPQNALEPRNRSLAPIAYTAFLRPIAVSRLNEGSHRYWLAFHRPFIHEENGPWLS